MTNEEILMDRYYESLNDNSEEDETNLKDKVRILECIITDAIVYLQDKRFAEAYETLCKAEL